MQKFEIKCGDWWKFIAGGKPERHRIVSVSTMPGHPHEVVTWSAIGTNHAMGNSWLGTPSDFVKAFIPDP